MAIGNSINSGDVLTLGGPLTTSGAFTTTFTMTGNTSVTFPTSGTLATTGGSVASITGTASQVLANGTSGSAQTGAVTLTLPQNIATSSSPTFTGLTLSGITEGSVLFAGTSGVVSQDNSNFFWNDSTNRLGLGTNSPSLPLDILGASNTMCIRLSDVSTDAATKTGGILCRHYTNASTAFQGLRLQSSASQNIVQVGGGSSAWFAATNVNVYAAATQTTTTGSIVAAFDIANITLGNTTTAVSVAITSAASILPASTGNGNLTTFSYGSTSGSTHLFQSAQGTRSSPTITLNNDILGKLDWYGYDGGFVTQSRFWSAANEAWSAGTARGTRLEWYVTPNGSTTVTQLMTLTGTQLSLARSLSGSSLVSTVSNTSNTAGSIAAFQVIVAGSTASDPYLQYGITGAVSTSVGLDNSDSDKYKVSVSSTAIGTNDALVITQTGEVTFPLTPAFLATATASQTNVTGDGTAYTMLWTEVFDQGGDFASNQFTAAVTGRYRLSAYVSFQDTTSSHTNGYVDIVTSNRSYFTWMNPFLVDGATAGSNGFSVLADMDAGDTASVIFYVQGGTKVVDIYDATPESSFFSGNLEC